MNAMTSRRWASRSSKEGSRTAVQLGEQSEALTKAMIAEFSGTLIDQMTCDELVRVICAAELLSYRRVNLQDRLPFYDAETLRRLAHLAKRHCQNEGT